MTPDHPARFERRRGHRLPAAQSVDAGDDDGREQRQRGRAVVRQQAVERAAERQQRCGAGAGHARDEAGPGEFGEQRLALALVRQPHAARGGIVVVGAAALGPDQDMRPIHTLSPQA